QQPQPTERTHMEILFNLIYLAPAALIAITFHEYAHGFVSAKLGDPTPKMQGRLSLNPLKHLDIIGTLALVFFGFGWAKPVNVDPRYYRKPKQGMMLVALAGPFTNFIIAFVCYFICGIFIKANVEVGTVASYAFTFFNITAQLNLGLGIFNLIPIPPLDGSKVLTAFLPERAYFAFMRYERYIGIALIALLMFGVLDTPLMFLRNGAEMGMFSAVRFLLAI
ncbi:MAG: site-2 protease family protein, partial [Oscillospiraceae bacterium]